MMQGIINDKNQRRFLYLSTGWLFICLFCSSCKTETTDDLIKKRAFEKSASIPGEVILESDNAAGIIYSIDSLLVTENNGTDYHYNIYSKTSERLLGKLGVKGDRKEAWNIVFYDGQFSADADGIKAWFTAPHKGQVYLVNLTQTIESGEAIPVVADTIFFDPNSFSTNHVYIASDSILFGSPGYFEEMDLRSCVKKIDLTTDSIKRSDLFPGIKNREILLSHEFYELYTGLVFGNDLTKKVVTYSDYFDRIDILNWDLSLHRSIVGEGVWEDDILDANRLVKDRNRNISHSLTTYYADMCATDNYIYALFRNQTQEERLESKRKSLEIHVFDWEGNSVYNFQIEDYLTSISVDQDDRFVYGVAFDDEKILKYDIYEYLHQ